MAERESSELFSDASMLSSQIASLLIKTAFSPTIVLRGQCLSSEQLNLEYGNRSIKSEEMTPRSEGKDVILDKWLI